MASNVGKHVLYCILRVARLSLIDAFTFLRLHHVNTVNATKSIRLKAWIKYAAKVIKNNPGAMKAVAEKYGDNDLVKFALHVLKSQRTENAATELETPLVGVSNGHKMSADAAATELETPLVGVSNGHKMSADAAATELETPPIGVSNGHKMSADAAATELETPLVGVSNGHKMSADAAATELETSPIGVSNGHKMSADAAATELETPLVGVSNGHKTSADAAATESETSLVGVSNGHKTSADAAATELETSPMGVSNGHKMSPEAAFTFIQPLNEAIPLMRVSSMKAWVEYVRDTDTTGFSDVIIMKVLNSVDAKDRLKILEIMREVPKTEQIVSMLEFLLLTDWKNQRIKTTHLFADLKLNTNVNDLLYNPNLDLYSKYAIMVIPNTTIELALVIAASKAYGPGPLAKMLMMEVRLKRKKHKLATTLLQVLYQQWQMMANTQNDVAVMCWSKGIMDLIDDEAEVVTGY
ncbi:unnamed protein product [Peronospora belbahrii]|uniref:Uncharacterized protein n=1 Tax=Peronospora belbahrii TaxID=622444 RepID=A0ABN8CS69_9STRA|nr:unnamed protein product [Peronospora belbahrii]